MDVAMDVEVCQVSAFTSPVLDPQERHLRPEIWQQEIGGKKEVSLERFPECLCVSVRCDKHLHLRDGRGFPQSRAHHACLFYFPSESHVGCPTRLCV